jgi:hypothetical protein
VISDEHIAESIRGYAREAITGTNVKNEPILYGSTIPGSLDKFRGKIEEVESIMEETSDSS